MEFLIGAVIGAVSVVVGVWGYFELQYRKNKKIFGKEDYEWNYDCRKGDCKKTGNY